MIVVGVLKMDSFFERRMDGDENPERNEEVIGFTVIYVFYFEFVFG